MLKLQQQKKFPVSKILIPLNYTGTFFFRILENIIHTIAYILLFEVS